MTAPDVVPDTLAAPSSQRNYRIALRRFRDWCTDHGGGLTRPDVVAWKRSLIAEGLAPKTVNLYLCMVRALARELADRGEIDHAAAAAVVAVRGVPSRGQRSGHWMTADEAAALLAAPGTDTLLGLRDTAMLAVMLGGGVRRRELVRLTVRQFATIRERPVIRDIQGKGNRTRTVPIPEWCRDAVTAWCREAGLSAGVVFRRLAEGGDTDRVGLSEVAVYQAVCKYAEAADVPDVTPHDLRRTFARLAYEGGAPMAQIQQSLGHASVQTTERYVSARQDFESAPCDVLGVAS